MSNFCIEFFRWVDAEVYQVQVNFSDAILTSVLPDSDSPSRLKLHNEAVILTRRESCRE